MATAQPPKASPPTTEVEGDRLRLSLERKQLQIEVTNAVVSKLSLKDLLVAVSTLLKRFINHDVASVVLYNEESQELRVHALDQPAPGGVIGEGTLLPINGTPPGLAITTRKTVRRDFIDLEEFHAPVMRQGYEAGLRCGCSVPLISHDRIFGTINVGSFHEAAFTKADEELLEQISGQVAIAVENALNFERANKERDRAEILLQVSNAITTNLDTENLLSAMSTCLRAYFKHDFAGLTLYDAELNKLITYALDLSRPDQYLLKGSAFPIEGTLNGLAFTSKKPVIRHTIDPTETTWPQAQKFFAEQGLKSYYLMPLLSRGRGLGVLNLGSHQENALSVDDLELLKHVASQVALAVENSLAYAEITSLKNKLASEKLYLEEEIQTEYNFAEIVGQSSALKKILQQVATVAATDSAVLIRGETGTGKELIARAIHNLSNRRERTLVKLNCAAIPTGLLESELFGHEKGAFTGAIAQRIGRFELAHKGTLFLDEVGEIPVELQPKLLRVLQEQEFERLGSSRTVKTDARLIAATNCDLTQMVTEKKFRSDLYYRLNVFPINIPSLRERVDDIPLLVGYFIQKHAARMSKRITTVDRQTVETLCTYHWPGNVRELENFVERAVILTSGSELKAPLGELKVPPGELVPTTGDGPPAQNSVASGPPLVSLEDVERAHIEEILRQTGGVIGGKGGAAELLGLPSSTLRNRMKKLGLK